MIRLWHSKHRPRAHALWQACDCQSCQSMCAHTPCWPSPREAERLIREGYAGSLMLSEGDAGGGFAVVSPAIAGHEGRAAPAVPKGACVFFTAERRCALHDLGLKPIEGRLAMCAGASRPAPDDLHHRVAMLWKTKRGRRTIEVWKGAVRAKRTDLSRSAGRNRLAWAWRIAIWALSAIIGGAVAMPAAAQTGASPAPHHRPAKGSHKSSNSSNTYPIEHGKTNQNAYPIEHGQTNQNNYPIEHGQTNGNNYPIEHGSSPSGPGG